MSDRVPASLAEQADELEASFLLRRGHFDVLRNLPEGKGRPQPDELNRLRDRLLILRDAAHTMKALAEKDATDA